MEAVYRGNIQRLVIAILPGMAKSMISSVMFPAWVWTKSPGFRILGFSYSEHLSLRDSRKMKQLIESDRYTSWYPHVKLESDQRSAGMYSNTEKGFRMATSVGGTVTGARGDLLILDDPISVGQADSEAEREKALRFMTETLPTRVNNEDSRIMIIAQRIHEMDPSGWVMSQYKNWDLDIFYATSSNIQVKYITSSNLSGTTASLPIRTRTTLEDQAFEYLSTYGKNIRVR